MLSAYFDPCGLELLTGLEVTPLHRELGLVIELFAPLTERIAEPRHLWPELGQLELFPNLLGVFHKFALRQRHRRERLLENRVAEHRRFVRGQMVGHYVRSFGLVLIEKRWSVALFHAGKDLHVLMRLHPVAHGPENRRL